MKIRTTIATAGAAAMLCGAGAFLLPAAASVQHATHTLKFTAVRLKSANFSRTTSGFTEEDLSHAGKIIGFDVIHVAVNPKTHSAAGSVALDTSGGFLYGTLKLSNSPVIHGTVTGGTGAFKGAAGTITGKSVSKTRTTVTIIYHT